MHVFTPEEVVNAVAAHPLSVLSGLIGPSKSRQFLWRYGGKHHHTYQNTAVSSISGDLLSRGRGKQWESVDELLQRIIDDYFESSGSWLKKQNSWDAIGHAFGLPQPYPKDLLSLKQALFDAIKEVKVVVGDW